MNNQIMKKTLKEFNKYNFVLAITGAIKGASQFLEHLFIRRCYIKFFSSIDAFKYSFFPSTILVWNKLDRKIR